MTTGRLSLFDNPLFLGFDHFEETFNRLRKSANEGYPPYNIEQISDTDLRISLAVAGFSMEDLDIEVENNQLTVRGKQVDEEERYFLHRGIAARQFQRSFVLADGIEVRDAFLDNGLLHIDLERILPETNTRKIKIKNRKSSEDNQAIDVKSHKKEKGKVKNIDKTSD